MWEEDGPQPTPHDAPRPLPARHVAILTSLDGDGRIAHAYWGRPSTESWLTGFWAARRALAFRVLPVKAPVAAPRPVENAERAEEAA